MDSTTDSGSSGWETWIQNVSAKVIGSASDAAYVQPYEIQKLRLTALGSTGAYYAEGQPTHGAVGGIPPSMLLLGVVAVVAVLMLKD